MPPTKHGTDAQSYPPALSTVYVASHLCQVLDPGMRTVAVLTAHQWMAAKGLGLTDDTLWFDGARWADALSRQLIAETNPAVAG